MTSDRPHGVEKAKADLPESQSAWQRISQELHAAGVPKGTSDAAGAPARPRELPQPINLMKPFPSLYPRPEEDWPAIPPL